MKKLLLLLASLCVCALPIRAQSVPPIPSYYTGPQQFAGVPTGTCQSWMLAVNTLNGNLYTCSSGAWVASGSGTATSANSVGSVFSVLNYGWVYDDSTDNCGTPVTSFMAAVNAYSGPGIPQVLIPEGSAGKAYKLNTAGCNLNFLIPVTIKLWGTLDCGTGINSTGCIILGPTNLVNFINAQTPPYTLEGTGTITGCVNVTTACIVGSLWVSQPRILHIHAANVGAGAAAGATCTNYFISFEGHNNAPQIIDTSWWETDATVGRCWSINNRTSAAGGTNSALIEHNTIIAAGAAPGFTAPCGNIGHSELGSASLIKGNQIYGFGEPMSLVAPAQSVMITSNQLDQIGCAGSLASADIHYGNGSNGTVNGVAVVGSYFSAGGTHAAAAISVAAGSSSAITGLTFVGNSTVGGNNKNIWPSAIPPACADCYAAFNTGFAVQGQNTSIGQGVSASGTVSVAQAANIAPATAMPTTSVTVGLYRVSCILMMVQAATTSSTLPTCSFKYTDQQSNTAQTIKVAITWASGGAGCVGSTTNTVGNGCSGSAYINAKNGTVIQYCSGNTACDANGTDYASVGGTAMQYTLFPRVERLGVN